MKAGGRSLLLKCRAHFVDGTSMDIVSNTSTWKQIAGPIVYDDIYNGVTYDASLETPGWADPVSNLPMHATST